MEKFSSIHKANDALALNKLGEGQRVSVLGRTMQVVNGRLTVQSSVQSLHRGFDGCRYNLASRGGRSRESR